MAKNVAFVTGAMGIVGKHVILELLSRPAEEWEVYAVSRRKPDFAVPRSFVHVELDLLGKIEDIAKKLQEKEGTSKITHIFFAAYQEKPTLKEQIGPNVAMLKNSVEAVEKVAPGLKHVSLIEGTKWYGVHLGASKTPQKEDDPRYMPPNFYYDQEDYLISRVKGNTVKWAWSALRPNPVCGIAFGNPMNLATGIAVYASICKELNIPFRFPGTDKGWRILLEVVDAGLLAKGLVWAATTPACANQAFNFSNGDIFRWCDVWGKFANFFGLELADGPIMQLNLNDMMTSNEDTWVQIRKKHPNLREIPFKDLTMWPFIDWVFTREYDWFADVNKARRFGFHEMTYDSGDMFIDLFKKMREEKIIP